MDNNIQSNDILNAYKDVPLISVDNLPPGSGSMLIGAGIGLLGYIFNKPNVTLVGSLLTTTGGINLTTYGISKNVDQYVTAGLIISGVGVATALRAKA